MKYRRFGTTDLTVSEIGFGCARLGGIFGNTTKSDMLVTLRQAADQGMTFFDTSDMYCQGESEQVLGEAFRQDRGRVILASKGGYCLPAQRKLASRVKPLLRPLVQRLGLKRTLVPSGLRGALSQDFRPEYIIRAAEQSLRRLQTDYLDVYQLHSPPAAVLEAGDWVAPLEKLKGEGKIRYYGVSCETVEDAMRCLRYPGISSLQLRLSLLDQRALLQVVPQAAEKGVAVIARECYAGGLLAKPPDGPMLEQFIPDAGERQAKRREIVAFQEIADQLHRPLPQLALQFVQSLPGISVTLLGMRTAVQLTDNLCHLGASALAREEFSLLRRTTR